MSPALRLVDADEAEAYVEQVAGLMRSHSDVHLRAA